MRKKILSAKNYFIDYVYKQDYVLVRLHFNEKGLTKYSFPIHLESVYDEEYNEGDLGYIPITTLTKLYKTRKFSNYCKYTNHYGNIQDKLAGNSF